MKNHTIKKSMLSSALLTALGSAHAATIVVDADCSLIDAITAANNDAAEGLCPAGSGADVIQISEPDLVINITGPLVPPMPSPNGLGSSPNALPEITSEVTIEGNGLTLNGAQATDPIRMFTVGYGGDLTLRDTTVSNTSIQSSYGGSGLSTFGGRVTMENTTFYNNYGAILLLGGTGNVLENTVIRHNTLPADDFAPGISFYYTNASVSNSSIIDNETTTSGFLRGGGGPSVAGGVSITQSEVTITNSTISGNQAPFGAGINIRDADPMVPRSLPPQFELSGMGGVAETDVSITNSTITNNQSYYAGGILNFSEYGTLTLAGSIVAGNKESIFDFAPNIYNEFPASLNLVGHNIIGDNGTPGSYGVTLEGSNSSFVNAAEDNLYPLTLSKGQLLHPLKVNSSAIDNNDLTCYGAINDQSGKARGLDGDGNGSFVCDIGASEHSQPIVANGAPCTLENAIISANNDASVGGCQPGNYHDIITLPAGSVQTISTAASDFGGTFYFGLPSIDTAITIEGNGSTFEKDDKSLEQLDFFLVPEGGQLNLINSTVSGADGRLGSIASLYGGNANVLSSKVINGSSVGVFDFFSVNSSLVDSTIDGMYLSPYVVVNTAAGMLVNGSSGFEMAGSTISNNENGLVGGIGFGQANLLKISNSTVSGNTGAVIGGMYTGNSRDAQVAGLTITNNLGGYQYTGGWFDSGNNRITMSNSIISGNAVTPPVPAPNVVQTSLGDGQLNMSLLTLSRGGGAEITELLVQNAYFAFDGNNILGQNADSGSYGVTLPPSVTIPANGVETVIETALADNGGNTLTHLPVDDGPAIDAGGSICLLRTDQLGRIRPWDGDGDGEDACDIGAVEKGSVTSSDLIFKDGFDAQIILRRSLNQ